MLDLLSADQKAAFKKSTAVKQVKQAPEYVWGLTKPTDYKDTYSALPLVQQDKPLERAFGNGPAAHSSPLIRRSALELQPNMYSFDERVLNFQRELTAGLNNALKPTLTEDLFTTTGIHMNFNRLCCPAGYFQSPMSYTTVDNELYRKELGLTAGYTPRQKAIATEVWKIVASTIALAPVNVPKLSTGGMRRFTSDPQWKLDYANWLYDAPSFRNFDKMLDMVAKGDAFGLANDYETIYATYIQKRGQVDDPGKVRQVFDLEFALTGGRAGKMFPADKRVILEDGKYTGRGTEYPDFSAIRARVVHAGPWSINCFLQVVATTTMKSLFKRYPDTFHVNTAAEIKAVVDGKYVFCSDVTEYDRSMSKDAISVAHDCMREHWDPRLVDASWRLFVSPYYAKPLSLDGKGGTWVKNPFSWTDEVFAGNRSGHAWTSLMAKVNKVIDTLFVIDRIYPVLGRCEEFMQGRMPMGFVNNGDDEIIWARVSNDLERFKKLRADGTVGHYVVKGEVGQGFSGLLLVRPTPGTVYFPTPRVHTPFEKMYVPERSIGGFHREYWPIGFSARMEALTSTDIGREAWAIHNSAYRKHLEPTFGGFQDMLFKATEAMRFDTQALTELDRLVLDAPDKLHHSVDPEAVSDDVLKRTSSKIPVDVVELFIKRYFKGVTL